jgi:hypothetical protein
MKLRLILSILSILFILSNIDLRRKIFRESPGEKLLAYGRRPGQNEPTEHRVAFNEAERVRSFEDKEPSEPGSPVDPGTFGLKEEK